MYEPRLFTPGPTHVPLSVRLASIGAHAHHRAPGYRELHGRVVDGLRTLFGTSGDVLLLSGSGTSAMETVVHNLVSPGDVVLVAEGGKYGRRWAQLAGAYQARVETYPVPPGATFDLDAFEAGLTRHQPAHVLLTHCETSTGVTHDVAALARRARAHGATVVVDAMATVGVEPVEMDAWGVDLAVTASHKGLMSPPGAAFVAVRPGAWSRLRADVGYSPMSLRALRDSGRASTTPNTPPISVLFAVAAALDLIAEETPRAVWERHAANGRACRAGVAALGLELFAQGPPAAAVTSVRVPPDANFAGLVDEVEQRFGMRIAGGQDELAGQILRIGHVGAVSPFDLLPLFAALEVVATERGLVGGSGPAVAAVSASLAEHVAAIRREPPVLDRPHPRAVAAHLVEEPL